MKKSKRGLWILGFLCVMVSGIVLSNSKSRAKTVIYPTVASGEQVKESNNCVIDYSNTADGYVMVKFKKALGPTLKCVVTTGGQALNDGYKYTLSVNKYQVIPLTEGNTAYTIYLLYEVGGRYAMEMTLKVNVEMTDQFGPYLNKIYKKKKGICFDYAAVMTAMLRSQGVPTKLIVGYTGNAYHAWINVYSKKKGRISKMIYFNGKKWKLMDPTFASTSKSSKSIMKYIGNGRNYKEKLSY